MVNGDVRRCVLTLMAIGGLAVGAVTSAAVPGPLSVAGGEKARTLTFIKAGSSATATLTLIVTNTSSADGTLVVRFVAGNAKEGLVTASATKVELPKTPVAATSSGAGAESANEPGALTVRLLPPATLSIRPHGAVQLRIRFRRTTGPDEKAKPISGNMIVSMTGRVGGGPLVVPLTVAEKAAANTALKFAQDKATISLTRWLGPVNNLVPDCRKCMAGESVEIGTRGTDPATAATTIHSESGGSATVDLKRTDDTRSTLEVTRVDRHGSYDGELVLDPDAEKPRSLAVAVKARDFLFWPLAAVLLGALIGAQVLKRHESNRNRDLVKGMIQDSVNPYVVAHKRPNGQVQRPNRFYLDHLLPQEGSPLYPKGKSCKNHEDLAAVPRLYCKAGELDGDSSLADLLPDVADVTGRFDRWSEVEDAISLLNRAISALTGPRNDPMREDAVAITVRGDLEPDDDKEASELVLLFNDEAAAVAAYRQARDLYDAQPPQWKDLHLNVDPDRDLDKYEPAETRTAANAEKVALLLLYKVAALKEADSIPEDPRPDKQEEHQERLVRILGARHAMSTLTVEAEEIFATAHGTPIDNVDTRTPQQIRADVRRADWTIFWLTAVLTALVYLAGKYSADWGSWEDYLFAVAAGAVAPSVITWSLIPYSRSYRPKAAGPASAE
jgi:hypothetical protein